LALAVATLGAVATAFGAAALGLAWTFLAAVFLAVLAAAGLATALGVGFLAAFKGADLAFNFLTADMLFVSGLNKAGFYTKTNRETQEIPLNSLPSRMGDFSAGHASGSVSD
jgi:hypothetical protein